MSNDIRMSIRRMLSESKYLMAEGPNDPGIFKAIFLSGCPGSGKGSVLRATLGTISKSTTPQGLKIVNLDHMYELLLKKQGLGLVDPGGKSKESVEIMSTEEQEAYKKEKSEYRSAAGKSMALANKRMTGGPTGIDPEKIGLDRKDYGMKPSRKLGRKNRSALEIYIDNRMGIVIDGTASNFNKVAREKKILEDLGYETMMISVDIPIETAIERNIERGKQGGRTIPRIPLIKTCEKVKLAIPKYQELFGSDFIIIDNTKKIQDAVTPQVLKKVNSFLARSISSTSAISWLNKE
ncbi:zeta toxin family protein [bacterium]|nr:zeta toxin family protein [bacterium]